MTDTTENSPLFEAAKRFSDAALRVDQSAIRLDMLGSTNARRQAEYAIKSARVALSELADAVKGKNGA